MPDMTWFEANDAVAVAVAARVTETVEGALEHAHEEMDERGIEWGEHAESQAATAGTLVTDAAVSMGQWTLKGLGMADYCGDQTDAEESEVIGRAVEHALLVVYGAAYAAALMACETY